MLTQVIEKGSLNQLKDQKEIKAAKVDRRTNLPKQSASQASANAAKGGKLKNTLAISHFAPFLKVGTLRYQEDRDFIKNLLGEVNSNLIVCFLFVLFCFVWFFFFIF